MKRLFTKRVVVVGQTPPPYGGQAVMIEYFLQGCYRHLELIHVRMGFSREMDEIGKFLGRKIPHLMFLVVRILWARLRWRAAVLYYPPAPGSRNPVLRDFVVLTLVRPFFNRVIFHFHGRGLGRFYDGLSGPLRLFYRLAYRRPAAAIFPSDTFPEEILRLAACYVCVVPNGVPDELGDFIPRERGTCSEMTVLFVGMVCRDKGIIELIEASALLTRKEIPHLIRVVGRFESPAFEKEARELTVRLGVSRHFEFSGVLMGEEKSRAYRNADVFCLPSHVETFGLVALEAMMYGLPVVATPQGALPILIGDTGAGLLVPTEAPAALADALAGLLTTTPEHRKAMGARGRRVFLKNYTIKKYQESMEEAILNVIRN